MNFSSLIHSIQQTHNALQQQAVKAINRTLTIRNWLIGYYIVEFEQRGEDRAAYGQDLVNKLATAINIRGLSSRNLHLFRLFYITYPQILQTLSADSKLSQDHVTIGQTWFEQLLPSQIIQTLSEQLQINKSLLQTADDQLSNLQTVSAKSSIRQTSDQLIIPPDKLITRLSFSHIVELLQIDNPFKRTFYEVQAIKGTWSVRELRRQINSLYFERSGISQKPEQLAALINEKAESLQPADIVKSVYAFEFLGLKAKDVIEESDLETALLDHLQQFMLELGHGFCLEARQQKILIGDEYFFIDLVFYHRILKCHVLVELKVEAFNHTNAGQLNTYLNYYKKEIAEPTDNPPVGILLVTNKNTALVEYATAGMDNKLFVSKYLVQLPSKEQLQQFVQNELKQL